ncbi:hypothetical protein NBRC110019_09670 [Neptunitalea chrysea]|uniref:Uncharacterized protein n=1 Tax=Neptunitalea chrysea TaxID=1647581 RepID=A0A9W6B731_9FLAO|nr:hypothetical protein NBRC110019_09670 [Neptunitalea chrysea]
MVFHTTTIVKAPKSAGKNFTHNSPLPNQLISKDIIEVIGGTDANPKAR